MRHEAILVVRFCSAAEAEIAERSLAPDNHPLPPYLNLGVERRGENLVYKVACNDRPLQTLLSTLDDILRALLIVEPIICENRGEDAERRRV
ncbi:hypothetical protein HRbin02_00269 [Candidatus Calditenuaceae archaeon HR02]|nr:hypothetical protein HRbin02_00269 [Candidatus Calditenuaceae archaeon HR02]